MAQFALEGLLGDGRSNAVRTWIVVVAVAIVGSGALLTGRTLWTVFAATLVVLAVLPPISFRSWLVMLPWEVVVLAALPLFGLALGADRMTGHFTSYLSVAAVALVIAVELQAFTSVRMTSTFAVVFVAVTTMATAGLWALLRWGLSGILGVPFPVEHDVIMWEFVYSAVAGLGAGAIFELYVRRLGRLDADLIAGTVPPEEGER